MTILLMFRDEKCLEDCKFLELLMVKLYKLNIAPKRCLPLFTMYSLIRCKALHETNFISNFFFFEITYLQI